MDVRVDADTILGVSPDVVVRDIEGELIIVPLVSGMGDLEDELYTLNATGRDIWEKLDGTRTLRTISDELAGEYDAQREEIEADVVGLANELAHRGMIVAVNKS